MAGVIKTKQGITTDGKKGGIFIGDRHDSPSGGIPIVVEGGGSALVEDSEPIITPEAVNNPKKHLFDGKQMTSKEILSAINTAYKGVPIKKKGGILEKGYKIKKQKKVSILDKENGVGMIQDALNRKNKIGFKFGNEMTSTGLELPNKSSVDEILSKIIKKYFFDSEFYYNFLREDVLKEEYKEKWDKEIKVPFLNKIDSFSKKYLIKYTDDKSFIGPLVYKWNEKYKSKKLCDNFFIKSKSISKELRDNYILYRWRDDNEKIDLKRYEYDGNSYYTKKIKSLAKGGTLNTEPIPVKAGSVIITRNANLDKTTKHNFNGKQLTNTEILSEINKDGGGVAFEEGGNVGEDINDSNFFKATRAEFKGITRKEAEEILDKYVATRRKKVKPEYIDTSLGKLSVNFESEHKSAFFQSRSLSYYFVSENKDFVVRISDHWSESNYPRSGKLNCGSIASCYWTNFGERFNYRLPAQNYSSDLIAGICYFKDFSKIERPQFEEGGKVGEDNIIWDNVIEYLQTKLFDYKLKTDIVIKKVSTYFDNKKNPFTNPKAEHVDYKTLKNKFYESKVSTFKRNKKDINNENNVSFFTDYFHLDEDDFIEYYNKSKNKFQNGGTINDSSLNKALELLQSTSVPSLFQQAKKDNPEELIKYIAEQGQGLHDDNKEALYNSTCKMFGKELTDVSIEAYQIRYKEGGETNNNYLATIITNDNKKITETFSYPISHKELMQVYSDKGIIIKEAEIIKESECEKGGLLREEKISVSTLHNKNKTIPASFINKQLAIGIKVEMEHTNNIEIAKEISLVHLNENIFYYEYLNKMEKELDQLDIDKHYEEIKESYGDGGTVNEVFSFKTPTGEKSRLTYIQQVLVRTSAFKNWFGDWDVAAKRFLADGRNNLDKHYKAVSKVLDYVTLEPRVVYHGTKAEKEFEEFDVTKKEGIGRPYAYFAQNKEYAENFTTSSQRGASSAKPILFNCFLNIRNPFYANTDKYIDVTGDYKYWINAIAETIYQNKYSNETEDFKKAVINSIESQILLYVKETYNNSDNKFWVLMARDSNKLFKFFLLSYDFDGVFYSEELSSNYDIEKPNQFTYAYTIFSADEVKLADGRNTKFNPFTNNIKLEQGGTISDVDNNVNQQINDMNKIEQLESILEKGGSFFKKGGSVNNNDFNSKLKHNFAEHNNTIPQKDHSKKLIETIYGNK